jgi:hypothetical protein
MFVSNQSPATRVFRFDYQLNSDPRFFAFIRGLYFAS